jgi:glutamate/tyrosine decarboxylase-like PLP-dependent enzyme
MSPAQRLHVIAPAAAAETSPNLDPANWPATRGQAHAMLDDMLDYIQQIRSRPVWQPIPSSARAQFREKLPDAPQDLADIHDEFMRFILPYAAGNVHPGFMGWVHGGGTVEGMLAEMLAAGLNANLGGRDHMPIEVERQVLHWVRELFGFPGSASGLFVTGTSMANLLSVLVARHARLGHTVRRKGVGVGLRGYAAVTAHRCIGQAFDLSGLGTNALGLVPVDGNFRMDIAALERAIRRDRDAGMTPFMVVGTAGTVDTGAIDDLDALAALAKRERLWFHVDGAFGALAMLSDRIAPRLKGIEAADSIAFDFHKWGQVPYDAGFFLVRDGNAHKDTFANPAAYLRREARGLAGGEHWPCDFGPDLSRGFRALKTWFTIKAHGRARLGEMIERSCDLAKALEARILAEPKLELLSRTELNIVCFRYRATDAINAAIVGDLQESGIAAPSTTTIGGKLAIRAALVNHRTEMRDLTAMLKAVLEFGQKREQKLRAIPCQEP